MIGKKTAAEYRTELKALLSQLPAESPEAWFKSQIEVAKKSPSRDAETLQMLCAALEREVKKRSNAKPRRRAAKR